MPYRDNVLNSQRLYFQGCPAWVCLSGIPLAQAVKDVNLWSYMRYSIAILTTVLMISFAVWAEEGKPDEKRDSPTVIERRADRAFERGQYSLAKDLYAKVADRVKADKKRFDAIQERIRNCDVNMKQLAVVMPVAPVGEPAGPQIEMSAEKRKKHVPPKEGDVYVTTMKEMGNFQYDADKGGNIPEDVKNLNGARIRVQGFMIPLDQADNITHFSLVPSRQACCFGLPPQIQHQVIVNAPKGKAVGYFPDEIVCEGTLKVQEKREDEYLVSIFELDVQSVKPAGN